MRKKLAVLLAAAMMVVLAASPALAVGKARCGIGAGQSYFALVGEPGDVGQAASGGAGETQGNGEISEAASGCNQSG